MRRNSDTTFLTRSFSVILSSARFLTFVPFPTRQPPFHYVTERDDTPPLQSYQTARRRNTRMKYSPVTISLSYYILSRPSRWGGARADEPTDGRETGMRPGCILSSHEGKRLRVSASVRIWWSKKICRDRVRGGGLINGCAGESSGIG